MNSDFARKGAIAIAVLALLVAAPLIFYACGGGANGGSAGSAEVNGLVITPGTGEVALRWDPSPGAKSYIIYWDAKPTAGDRSQKTGAINLKSGGTSLNNSIKVKRTFYQHKGLRLNWIYFYVVLPFPDENPDDIHTPHPEIPAGGCQTENGCYFLYPYLCGDYCTSLDTDNNNCGSCGAICPTGTLCSS
ncbi:MAG: hypothetical protein OEV92_08215, partial [Nitrospinota bacterium]|nr:hypothetical protein [Nitrospinota bacterium]